jgi:hypothetical protein
MKVLLEKGLRPLDLGTGKDWEATVLAPFLRIIEFSEAIGTVEFAHDMGSHDVRFDVGQPFEVVFPIAAPVPYGIELVEGASPVLGSFAGVGLGSS